MSTKTDLEEAALCKCGAPSEWADEFCQDCWESYCAREWWKMVITLPPNTGSGE